MLASDGHRLRSPSARSTAKPQSSRPWGLCSGKDQLGSNTVYVVRRIEDMGEPFGNISWDDFWLIKITGFSRKIAGQTISPAGELRVTTNDPC